MYCKKYCKPPIGHIREKDNSRLVYNESIPKHSGCTYIFLLPKIVWMIYQWASYQIRKIAGCACTGNAGNVFPATNFNRNRLLMIPACITARAVMHVGIANPRWRGKHSRRMRNPNFYVSGKRPIDKGGQLKYYQTLGQDGGNKTYFIGDGCYGIFSQPKTILLIS